MKQRKTVTRPYHPLRASMGRLSVISTTIKSSMPVRLGLTSNANRLPAELRAGLLASNWVSASFAPFRQRSVNHSGVVRCLDSLRRNPRLKMFQLTAVSGLSRRGLNKAFLTHLGCTPGVVMIVLRLRTALNLLIESRLPIPAVAVRSGYRNSNGLYVAFRHYLGITPLSVRKPSFPWAPFSMTPPGNVPPNSVL